ncbi:MAG: hypothetical protein LBE47_01820 [Methanomassiliicoccaceae archaeon]|jgi:hypothetical protein|nr:hypothetical protein [Methanomassiliicoccaceae archaeon]
MKMSNAMVAITVAVLMIAGGAGACFLLNDNDSSDGPGNAGGPEDPDAPIDVVQNSPYLRVDASTRYKTSPVEDDYRIDYHTNTGLYSIYYIYLGSVDNVPISWEATRIYNGKTPVTMTYSTGNISEGMISGSTSACSRETTETVLSKGIEQTFGVRTGFDTGLMRTSVEAGWRGWGSKDMSASSVSTTDTLASFKSWSNINSSVMTMPLGENEEEPGFYRYTLFATADVYVTVVVDHTTGNHHYEYSTFARPATYEMKLDYSEDHDFTKQNDLERFRFTDEMIGGLPESPADKNTMLLDYRDPKNIDNSPIVVPCDTAELIIVGKASQTINKNIIINARNTDLRIILSNVKLVAPQGKAAIQDMSTTSPYHAINFVLFGDNSVTGGTGARGSDGFPGKTGGNGSAGIDVTRNYSITMSGPGKLTVSGGQGGQGGNGSDSKAENTQRRGGNGGNGGVGIICKDTSFEKTGGKITVIGGNGGNGGKGGNSTEIPLMTGLKADGGHGGTGGRGGWAMDAREAPKQTMYSTDPLSLFGGRGGGGGGGGAKAGFGTVGSPGASGTSAQNNHWFNGSIQVLLLPGGA